MVNNLFEQEPVDVSKRYGLGLMAAGGLTLAVNYLWSADAAVFAGTAALFTSGLGFWLGSGNRVIQMREKEMRSQ